MMMKEMVLYYNPNPGPDVAKLKGVLVRMGIRIKNVGPEQVKQKVGYLAGMPGFAETDSVDKESMDKESEIPFITEEMLVMKNFSSRRIDELLANLKKAGVPKIALKAVITEQNSQWTFCQLYEELREEHKAMTRENLTVQENR